MKGLEFNGTDGMFVSKLLYTIDPYGSTRNGSFVHFVSMDTSSLTTIEQDLALMYILSNSAFKCL